MFMLFVYKEYKLDAARLQVYKLDTTGYTNCIIAMEPSLQCVD